VDGGQEVARSFVVASGESTKEFEFGKEVFDQMPGLVEVSVVVSLQFAIGLRRYDRGFAGFLQGNQDTLIGIEAFVGEHHVGRNLPQQHIGPVQIAGLTAGEMKADGVAQGIDRSMNLGAQPAFAATDGLVEASFFSAPALCW